MDEFEQILNDIYPEVDIAGYTYPAGYALRQIDPIAFREEYLAHESFEEEDLV